MVEKIQQPATGEERETVLWHTERIDIAIVCVALLIGMVKFLISFVREHGIFDMWAVTFFWGLGFLAVFSVMIWSVGVSTVVRKNSEDLTISSMLGHIVCGEVQTIPLKFLTDVVARERSYGFKGRTTRRFQIQYGPARQRSELLGRLTRDHVVRLQNGVLRGTLRIENP